MSKKPVIIVGNYEQEWEHQARLWPEEGFMTAVIGYYNAILAEMERQKVSRAELARRTQLKPSYISRVLNNPENITMRTAFRLCHALDLQLGFDIKPYPEPLYSEKKPKASAKSRAAARSTRPATRKQPAAV